MFHEELSLSWKTSIARSETPRCSCPQFVVRRVHSNFLEGREFLPAYSAVTYRGEGAVRPRDQTSRGIKTRIDNRRNSEKNVFFSRD